MSVQRFIDPAVLSSISGLDLIARQWWTASSPDSIA